MAAVAKIVIIMANRKPHLLTAKGSPNIAVPITVLMIIITDSMKPSLKEKYSSYQFILS